MQGQNELAHLHIKPDYGKTVRGVYKDVAISAILRHRDLNVLSYARGTAHVDTERWPSWVPRWDYLCPPLSWGVIPGYHNAARGYNLALPVNFSRSDDILRLNGIYCGSVEKVTSIADLKDRNGLNKACESDDAIVGALERIIHLVTCRQPDVPFKDWALWILHRLTTPGSSETSDQDRTSKEMSPVYLPLGSIYCDNCKCTVTDESDSTHDVDSLSHYHCDQCWGSDFDLCTRCYDDLGARCAGNHDMEKVTVKSLCFPSRDLVVRVLKEELKRREGIEFDEKAYRAVETRIYPQYGPHSLFLTLSASDGRLEGTATGHVKVGDVVVVLFGGRVPFILRPLPDRAFRYVSDCFVEGLMKGEAIQLLKGGKLESHQFEIR